MRRFLATVSMIVALAACGGSPEPSRTPPPSEPVSTPGKIIDRASSVADQANQRTADLESMLDNG